MGLKRILLLFYRRLVVTETDQAGSITAHTYDPAARHVTISQPDPVTGLQTSNSPLTQMGYDATGNLISLLNPLGNQWNYAYDSRNRKIKEIQPPVANAEVAGAPVQVPVLATAYDGVGNVTSKTSPRAVTFLATTGSTTLGSATITVAGATGVTAGMGVTGPGIPVGALVAGVSGTTVVLTVPATATGAGIAITFTATPYVTTMAYDHANRLVQTIYPAVPVYGSGSPVAASTYTAFDFNGNILTVTDENGNVTTNTYDALNRLLTTTAPVPGTPADNIVEQFAYDPVGNRTLVTDGNGLQTFFAYDGLNRLLTTTYDYGTALAKTITDVYDALNKTTRTDATSRVTGYLYDQLNRLANVNYIGRPKRAT